MNPISTDALIVIIGTFVFFIVLGLFVFYIKVVITPKPPAVDRRQAPRPFRLRNYMYMCADHVATHIRVGKPVLMDNKRCDVCKALQHKQRNP
jgi:hypothetical protein